MLLDFQFFMIPAKDLSVIDEFRVEPTVTSL